MTACGAPTKEKEIKALIKRLHKGYRAPASWADLVVRLERFVEKHTGMQATSWIFMGAGLSGVLSVLMLLSPYWNTSLLCALQAGACVILLAGGCWMKGVAFPKSTLPPDTNTSLRLAKAFKEEPLLAEVFEAWMKKSPLGSITAYQAHSLLGAHEIIQNWREWEKMHAFTRNTLNASHGQVFERLEAEKRQEQMEHVLPQSIAQGDAHPSTGKPIRPGRL